MSELFLSCTTSTIAEAVIPWQDAVILANPSAEAVIVAVPFPSAFTVATVSSLLSHTISACVMADSVFAVICCVSSSDMVICSFSARMFSSTAVVPLYRDILPFHGFSSGGRSLFAAASFSADIISDSALLFSETVEGSVPAFSKSVSSGGSVALSSAADGVSLMARSFPESVSSVVWMLFSEMEEFSETEEAVFSVSAVISSTAMGASVICSVSVSGLFWGANGTVAAA